MSDNEISPRPELQHSVEQLVAESIGQIEQLAVLIGGEGASVEDVFALPPEVRKDASEPDWDEEQVAAAREVAHSFGFGAERNVPTDLEGGVRILEPGLAWKIVAETEALADEDNPSVVVFAGNHNRKLRPDEQAFLREKFGTDLGEGATEYGLASFLADMYATSHTEQDMGLGYEVAEGNPTVEEATGQLLHVGDRNGQDILLLRVDRENYIDAEEATKYRYQPDTAALMGFMSEVLAAYGDEESPVGMLTSNAYASRVPDAVRAGLHHNREFAVAMYGRQTLAEVKSEELKPDSPLNQLPGDLGMLHFKLQALMEDLNA